MPCAHCTDPDGEPCFPSYGVAPHVCHFKIGRPMGGSVFLPESDWPDNFKPDPDNPGCGTYWCPKCGHGKPETVKAQQ